MYTASARVEIAAPIGSVWRALVELDAYPEWNPFVVAVRDRTAALAVGVTFRIHLRFADGSRASSGERVTALVPPAPDGGRTRARFAYRYTDLLGSLGLVRAEREHVLEQLDGGPTIYSTREHFHGLLRRFVPIAKVQDGFDRQTAALKQRAESQPP